MLLRRVHVDPGEDLLDALLVPERDELERARKLDALARKLGRHSIGIDLSAEYLALAAKRLQQQSLFAEVPGA